MNGWIYICETSILQPFLAKCADVQNLYLCLVFYHKTHGALQEDPDPVAKFKSGLLCRLRCAVEHSAATCPRGALPWGNPGGGWVGSWGYVGPRMDKGCQMLGWGRGR